MVSSVSADEWVLIRWRRITLPLTVLLLAQSWMPLVLITARPLQAHHQLTAHQGPRGLCLQNFSPARLSRPASLQRRLPPQAGCFPLVLPEVQLSVINLREKQLKTAVR